MTEPVLERILATKREEVATMAARLDSIGAPRVAPSLDVDRLRRQQRLALWTEIKRRSPSVGALSTALSPVERARVYEREGASVISVLTDRTFFDGSFEVLRDVASSVSTPCLCKEFVIDELQVEAAVRAGARLVLLIARIVDAETLASLVRAARRRGLEPLVEVVTEAELESALRAGARVIGVNARDLDTLVMDASRARRVLAAIPERCVAVYLSGVRSGDEIASLASSTRADGVLTGEALMREDEPSSLLRAMIAGATLR
ncbi:MAG: indole-3-glycerol phosphate synthase TrpC [Polyangiaceae bacterium]